MAVGLPLKTTYADGDVWSASDVDDITGTVNQFVNSQFNAAGKNYVINGGFDIWQRGTSLTPATTLFTSYQADRWSTYAAANWTVSRQATGDITNLPNIQYCARYQRNSGNTATTVLQTQNTFETVNSIPLAGKTVILSFYARRGANYSAASNVLNMYVYASTTTDANISGFAGTSQAIAVNATLTTTWQKFTGTATLPTNTTQIAVYGGYTPVGTAGAADYFEITGVQLELGSYATPFSRAGGTIQGELAACQRYYQVMGGTASQFPMATGYASAASQSPRFPISFPVQMRTAPSITKNGTWATGNTGQPIASYIGINGFAMELSSSAAGQCYAYPDSTDDTFTINAEL